MSKGCMLRELRLLVLPVWRQAGYLAIMGHLAVPLAGACVSIEDTAVQAGLAARADVCRQQQELAVVGQLKVQLARLRLACLTARYRQDIQRWPMNGIQ